MLTRSQRRDTLVSPRIFLISLLVTLLVFPPWAFGDPISWNGSAGDDNFNTAANWTDWSCQNCTPVVPSTLDNVSIHPSHTDSGPNVNLDLEGGIDSVTVSSMSIRGGHGGSTASLNVYDGSFTPGSGLTLGIPFNTTGNVLSVGNGGTLNVYNGGVTTLELSGGGGPLWPNSPDSVGASVATGGAIDVTLGALVLQNQIGGTRVLTNNGNIAITEGILGLSAQNTLFGPGALNLPASFVLSGSGTLTLGDSSIIGNTGLESLVNGPNHTIAGSGAIFGLASVTNNGTLSASGAPEEQLNSSPSVATGAIISEGGAPLVVDSNLTNWNGVNGKLTNGTYSASNGGVLQISSIGGSNSIQTLNLANVILTDTGSIVNAAGNNAVTGLSTIKDSTVVLNGGAQLTISPSGNHPSLTLSSDSIGVPASLILDEGAQLTVNGTLKTSASTYGLPTQSATSGIGVYNGSILTVNNLSTSSKNAGASSDVTVDGTGDNVRSQLIVNNNVRQGGGFGSPLSTGNNTLSVTNGGSVSVGGNFSNNAGGSLSNNTAGSSIVTVDDSFLTVAGTFSQWQGNGKGSTGVSQLNVTDNSSVTVGNLRNSSSVLNSGQFGFTPQSQISVTGGAVLTVNNNFANINNAGTLSGGSYTLGANSNLVYNGTTGANLDINSIGENTLVTLDNGGNASAATGTFVNAATTNSLAATLNTVNGALALQNGATLNLASSLSIGGQVSLNGGSAANTLTANGLTNNGILTVAAGDTADFRGPSGTGGLGNLSANTLTGGTYNIAGTLVYGTGSGGSPDIYALNGANVSLTGSGSILYGPNGATTDALANVSDIYGGSSLTLNSTTAQRSFTGLYIDNQSSLTLNNSSAALQMGGGENLAVGADNEGAINVNGGSSLVLVGTGTGPGAFTDGGSLNIGSTATGYTGVATLRTQGGGTAFLINGGGNVTLAGQGQINVATGDSLTVAANLTNWTGNGSGGGTLTGGSYVVGGGSTLQIQSIGTGNTIQNVTDASITVTGSGQINGGTPVQSAGQSNGLATGANVVGPSATDALTGLTALTGSNVTLIGVGNSDVPYVINSVGGPLTLSADTTTGAAASLNLRQGSTVQVNGGFNNTTTTVNSVPVQSQLNITNGSNFTINGNGAFQNVMGSEGSGTLSGGSYLIGGNSQLNYTGVDVNTIDYNTTLTLGGGRNGAGLTTGQLLNGGSDALSTYLNTVNGTLALQNGATLILSPNANVNNTNSSNTFTAANGNVSIAGGSILDVSALGSGFQDVDGNGVMKGNYLIGSNSFLNYSGTGITQITGNLTLDNAGGGATGMITNGGAKPSNDALSGSLTTVANGASLTLQNGATLSLTSSNFTSNYGYVSITNGSALNLSANTNFTNVDGTGLLNGGNFLIGSNSSLNYTGVSINTINYDATLVLDNAGGTLGTTGTIMNAGVDALSNSLTTNNGGLVLQNGASLTLGTQAFTNGMGAGIGIDVNGSGGSTLTTNGHFTNYDSVLAIGGGVVGGGGGGIGSGTTLNANAGFANKADDNVNVDYEGEALTLISGATANVTGRLFNGAIATNGSQENFTFADAELDLTAGSNMTVNGSVKNLAVDTSNGSSYSTANINIDGGSSLVVNGTFRNDSANFTGFAALNLTNNSTATISGLFTNTGGSLVSLDSYESEIGGEEGNNGGSSLTAEGGFKNYNSAVTLSNSSALTVSSGFLNLADDSNNSQGLGESVLALGDYEGQGLPISDNEPSQSASVGQGNQSLNGSSIATITGGLVNNAATSNGQQAYAVVSVNDGSILNVDNFTNTASVNTPGGSGGPFGEIAKASVFVDNGSYLNVTGNLSNSTSVPFFFSASDILINASSGSARASINVNDSTLTVGGAFTNTNAQVVLCSNAFLNSTGGVLNSATDTNADLNEGLTTSGYAKFSLTDSAAKVTGGFTNSAASLLGGQSFSELSLDNSYMKADTLSNVATGALGSAVAKVEVTDNSYLHVTGNVSNTSSTDGGTATALIAVNSSSVQVDGAFNNTSGTLALLNGSTVTVAGLFSNDSGSVVNLDKYGWGGSALYANGGVSNEGLVSLYNASYLSTSTYTQTSGTTSIGQGSTLQGEVEIQGGLLTGGGSADNGVSTVQGDLTVDGGTLNPGDPQDFYVDGYYDQTAIGILALDFGDLGDPANPQAGIEYDQLDVTGDVNLDGTLTVNLEDPNGFNAELGDVFDIINWGNGTLNGDFSNFVDPVFDNGTLTFQEVQNIPLNQIDLVVVDVPASSATPEPSTLSMLFCAMLLGGGITWRTRRRRSAAEPAANVVR